MLYEQSPCVNSVVHDEVKLAWQLMARIFEHQHGIQLGHPRVLLHIGETSNGASIILLSTASVARPHNKDRNTCICHPRSRVCREPFNETMCNPEARDE